MILTILVEILSFFQHKEIKYAAAGGFGGGFRGRSGFTFLGSRLNCKSVTMNKKKPEHAIHFNRMCRLCRRMRRNAQISDLTIAVWPKARLESPVGFQPCCTKGSRIHA